MRTEMNDFVFCLNEELEVFSQSFLFYQYHLNYNSTKEEKTKNVHCFGQCQSFIKVFKDKHVF